MEIKLEEYFSQVNGFKGITYNNILYLNNEDDEDDYVSLKIAETSQNIPKTSKSINNININKELWLMFNPKSPTKTNTSAIIAIKLDFLSNKYPIELYLILTVNFNKKLFIHITNSSEFCYIRSNNKFLISRTNRGVSATSITDVYSHYNIIYTGIDSNINNSAFYPSILNNTPTYDNTSELSIALSIYPSIIQSQINQLKIKKEVLYNVFNNHRVNTPLCYQSECILENLLEKLAESGILTTIKKCNEIDNKINNETKKEINTLKSFFTPLVQRIFVNDNKEKTENNIDDVDENKNDEVSFSFKLKPKK